MFVGMLWGVTPQPSPQILKWKMYVSQTADSSPVILFAEANGGEYGCDCLYSAGASVAAFAVFEAAAEDLQEFHPPVA